MGKFIKILVLICSILFETIYFSYAQDNTVALSMGKPTYTFGSDGTVVNIDIYLRRLGLFLDENKEESDYSVFKSIDITFNIDATAFDNTRTDIDLPDSQNKFVFESAWNTVYTKRQTGITSFNVDYGIIAYVGISKTNAKKLGDLPLNEDYFLGTLHWKLLKGVTHYKIELRDNADFAGENTCGGTNYDDEIVDIICTTKFIEEDVHDPLAGVEPPVDLAGNTLVCGTPQTLEYTVTRPSTVDSCAWFISTDADGNNPLGEDVASIVMTEKGAKAAITWKKTTGVGEYYVQVKSVKGSAESNPVNIAVRVEDFPDFAASVTEKIECRSTQLTWVSPKDGIITHLYVPDYSGTALSSPYVCSAEGTYHYVRYRDAKYCRDTVDFNPSFLDPRIEWAIPPVDKIQRGKELSVLVYDPTGIPAAYTPANTDFLWVKPEVQGKEYKAYVTTAVNKKYEFEVSVEVDGCPSNTLTGETTVEGGGIKPMLSTESGQEIACKNGGVLLKTQPDGGSGNYSYKWYAGAVSGTPLATSMSVWVSPTTDTEYFVVVTDEDSGEEVQESITITYKELISPVITAGTDQQIVSGAYTYLLGSVITDGASTNYSWNWKPADKLAGVANTQNVQTAVLTEQQKYAVYVVDDNGCMSKPDTVNIAVDAVLPPDLQPDVEDEFALAVVPENAVLCKNNSVQFEVVSTGINLEGAAYAWSPATGLNAADIPNPVLTANAGVTTGEYFVTVTKGDFSIIRKVGVTVNTAEEAPQLQLAENRTSCTGDVIELVVTGTEPDQYVWIVDGVQVENTEKTYTLADAGEHEIKVYGKNSGSACASDTISVSGTIGEGVLLTDVTPDVKICGTEAVLSFASITPGDAAFKWLAEDNAVISATDKSITVDKSGEYRLISGTGVCTDTNRIQVVLNNVLAVEGLKPVITGCLATADLAFVSTTAPSFVWLNAKGEEIADSKNQNPYTVSTAGIYQLRLDGGDCQETIPVSVVLNTAPVVNDVMDEMTTCGNELAICGSASEGTLYWSEDKEGNTLVTTGILTGSNETKTYYVYADAGEGCKSEPQEVKVTFGSNPKVIADVVQTTCEVPYTLRASTTGTGNVKWYESQTARTPVSNVITNGDAGTSREYWACAEDGEGCVSERVKVLVKFGVAPILEVDELQTTCGTELELTASATGGKLIWKEVGTTTELLLTKITGNIGDIRHYEVYAADGSCSSETKTVEVRFGAKPEVLADNLYTTCGEQFTLTGSASAGTLNWYSNAAGTIPLTSLTVHKGASDVATYYAQAVDGSCTSPVKDVRVAFGSNPHVEALTPQTSCSIDAVIALQATTTGGNLIWENADGTKLSSSTVNTAGTYYVYAEDGSCKSTKEEVEVKFGTDPVIDVESVQTTCGKEYNLVATTSGGLLKWYDSPDFDRTEINTLVTGNMGTTATYYVKAVDGACESAEVEVTVKFGMPPTVTVQPEINTCENVVKLEAVTTGGTLYWKKKSTGEVLSIPQVTGVAGTSETYVVYAQDATCKSPEKEMKINFGNKPEIHVMPSQTACGEEYTLVASAADGAIVKWLMADKTTELSDLTVTGSKGTTSTYWVYADKDGCSSDMTEVTVAFGELPKVEVTSPQTTCGTTITLAATTSGGTAVWKKADGSELINLTVTGMAGVTDTYFVSAEDGACKGAEEKVEVQFGMEPRVIVEKDITTCDEEYTLTAGVTDPQATIHWLEEDKLTPVTVAKGASGSSKKYYVYASTPDCEGQMTEVTVHFGASPVLTVKPITACDTLAVLVAESSVSNLIWTDKNGKELASTQVHGKAGSSEIYYVQAQDGKCVSSREAVQVDFGKAPELIVEDIQTVCTAEEYELQAQATGKADIVWYQADGVTPLANTTIKKVGNNTLIYYAEAQDGTCASEKKKVSVLFDQAPLLNIEKEVQTTCGESLTLQASASAGEVVWMKPDGTVLDLPQVAGTAGEVQQYYAYAQDGTCESAKKVVEVRFGTIPEVDVNEIQTACGESYTLTAIASDGVLHWLEADQITELKSTTVSGNKGTEKTYYVYAENGGDCKSGLYPVTVMFGTAPMIVDALNPQTTCGTSLQLTANATAGDIEWRDALGTLLTTTMVTQTTPGDYIYYVQAKDETCSSASQEIQVKFGSRPKVLCEEVQVTCSTSSYDIVATATEGILHYLDSDRKTELSSATVTSANTYYVYAQAPDCVSDTVAVEVKFGTKPVVTVPSNVQSTCEDVVQLQATATGGELFWEKLTPEGNIEPLLIPQVAAADGITTCYVYAASSREDESCRSEKQMITLDFGAKPEVFVEKMQTTCATTDYELQATASTGATVHWLAQDGVTPLTSTIVSGAENTTATYWVYADMGSCRSDKQEVTVAFGVAPVVSVLDTLTSCNTILTLSATTSAGTLKWLDERQTTEITNTTINNVIGTPKVYYVYAQDGGCESVKHKVVALFKTQPAVLADLLQTTCDPETYELKAQATEGTLHWLASDKTPLTSTIVKGKKGESHNYYVYAEKNEGCKSKEYQITVEFGADPMLEIFTPQTVCGVGEVIVDLKAVTTGGKLIWKDESGNVLASTQQKATAPTTKYYYVHAEDKTCMSVPEKIEVRFGGQPVVLVNELQTACGESLTLSGTVSSGSLVWSDDKGELTSTTVTPEQGDTYYVMAKDGECESTSTTVKVLFNTNPVVDVVTPQTTCGTQLQLKAETTGGELIWLNANGDKINLTQITAPKGTKATYFVYAKGETCESPKEMVEVEFGTTPKVIVEEKQTACGTSHTLTASATDGELVWLDASKNLLSSTTVTGTRGESKDYYVYAKAIDCESEPQKVTVYFGQSPVVFANALQTTCEKGLVLQASATAGDLVWTTEDGTELATPLVTGNEGENAYYYVTAKDGACQSPAERVEVRFGTTPEVLLASDVFTTCGTEYMLEAEATSGQVNWYASKESTTKLASTLVKKPDAVDYAEYYVQAQHGTCVGERQKVTVVFGSKPLVTVTTPKSACDSIMLLSATTTAGNLVWRNDKNEVLTSPLVKGEEGTVGVYYVQAQQEDGSCQSEIKEVFVNFGTPPSVNVKTDQTVCETKLNLQATATGGSVYWLKNDKLPLPSTQVEGVKGSSERYYVYAGDGSCVSDTVEVNVAFGVSPQLDAVDIQTSCGNVVELQGNTSGGTLKWTTAEGTLILPAVVTKPASADQLTCYVQAVDGSCSTDRKPVTVKFGTAPEVFAESLQTSCDTIYTLMASASAGNLVWEDQEHNMLTSTTVHGKGVKTYYVYASAGKDCVSDKIKVKVAFGAEPVVNVAYLQTACSATALELKATTSAGTLVWEKEDGTKLTQTTVTPEMGDIYHVYAQDGKCKSRVETVAVQFNADPVITVEPLQTTCGTELVLQASASVGDVIWINEDSQPIDTKLSSANGNTQKVYVYAQDGSCQSVPELVTVKFDQRPVLHDLQSIQAACTSPYQLQATATGGEMVWLKDGKEIVGNWVDLVEGENIFFVHVVDESCSPVASADEKVTVVLGGRPELVLSTTQCTGDSIFVDEVNGIGDLTYRWFVNGKQETAVTGRAYAFTEGGEYTVKVVAETAAGCTSDTISATYQIAAPVRLAWDPKPVNSVVFGNNIQGCVKVAEGEATDLTWNWLSPATPAITGSCVNISAVEQEYRFEVYATNKQGCSSDTMKATTNVTGFGDLEITLESNSGTEICKDGSALLTASVNGGQPPFTYEWFVKGTTTAVQMVKTSSAVNVLAVAPLADVTYVVKVRDSQVKPGIANKEIALTIKEATIPVADAGPDMTIQKGMQTVLKAGGGEGITAWEWLPVEKLAAADEAVKQYPLTINLATSRKYQLYVTNAEGCISKPDEMIVYVLPLDGTEEGLPTPPVSEGLNLVVKPEKDTLCLGAERWIAVKDMLGNLSSSATYTWVAEPAVTLVMNTRQDSVLFIPAAAGDYTFSVFVEDGGKKMALRSTIHVKNARAPQFDLVTTGNCQNDTVKIKYKESSVKATQWEWKVKGSVVANAADYYVLSNTGNYKVEVKVENDGCGSDLKAAEVTVGTAPVISGLAVVDSCGRAVIEVTATGATAGYTWIANPEGLAETGTDNRYVITAEGKYKVKVEASNGTCAAVRSLEGEVYSRPQLLEWVTEPMDASKTNVSITAAVAVQAGGKPDFTYHWLQPEEAKTTTDGTYSLMATLANYTFEVYASDANGCLSDTLKKSVAVTGGSAEISVESVYGKEICQGGAAMLVAHAQGVELPCVFEWSKVGTAGIRQSATQNSEYDTLWIKASEAGDYRVQVKQTAASAILASAKIEGLTVSTTKHAPVVLTERTLTVPAGGKTVLLASVSNGTPEYQWHWSPADKLETLADTGRQYPQTKALDSRQEYRVYVTDAVSCVSERAETLVDVDNKNGLCVAINPKNAEICRGNSVYMNADVSCGKPTDYKLEYNWLPADQSALLDATNKEAAIFTPVKEGEYTWVVQVKNGTMIAAARAVVTVKDADAPALALKGRWDCVNDTLILTNSGEPAEKYVWTVDDIEVAETSERLVLTDAGVKGVQVYAVAANGCLSDSISVETQLGVVPEIEIANGSFVNYPDSVNVLKVKQADGLTTDNYEFAWTSSPENKINGAKNLLSAVTLPMSGDVRYAFVATSKANAVCRASDTVWGYMVPKSAPVEIDKDENTGNLHLAWKKEDLGLADSVRIMNVKWDGYAVESFYKQKAMAKAEMEKYIIDSSKDTLEFFYINASRYIPEMKKSYYSLSSDTVGYLKQWLYGNAPATTQQNFIGFPFDMVKQNVKTTGDIIKYIGFNSSGKYALTTLAYWSGSAWKSVTASAANIIGSTNNVDIVLGSVYRVILRSDESVEFLLFGNLPQKFVYKLNGENQNFILTPLSVGYRTTRYEVGDLINNIKNVGSYIFQQQSWKNSTLSGSGVWGGTTGDFNINVLRPLRIILNPNTPEVDWKY